MKQHRTRLLALGVASFAVLAAVLALATGSRAASGNICKVNSGTPPSNPASCVTETVAPPYISTAADHAVSFTKFHNEAGVGGATATHVVLKVTFPDAATIDYVALWTAKPGSTTFTQVANPGCTTTAGAAGPPATPTVVSCPVGNIAGDGRAKMVVQFTGSSGGQLTGNAQYGEGGGGPSQPPNDDQINWDFLFVGSGDGAVGAGGCSSSGGTATSSALEGQITSVTVGSTNDPTLLNACTYFDAGVKPSSEGAGGSSLPISFVDFPTLSDGGGFATVTITFPSTYKVSNKTLVDEDTNYAVPYFTTFITLANCDRKGGIVVDNKTTFVGTPPKGETNTSVPRYYDACILNRIPSTNQIVVHALANPLDFTGRGH